MSGYRRPYTYDEENKILRYIIEKEAYYNLRGVQFWKELEDHKVVSRTWQSAKEHFRKAIYPNLRAPVYKLTDEEISSIRNAYEATSLSNTGTISQKNNMQLMSPGKKLADLENMLDSTDEDD